MAILELRRAKRYQLQAATDFWWPNENGSPHTGHGTTRDISANGIMINSHQCPPVGVRIQVTVFTPSRQDRRYQMELHGEGTVVRIVQTAVSLDTLHTTGFAASVQLYPEPQGSTE